MFKKNKISIVHRLDKYMVEFITIDGVLHRSKCFNWIDCNVVKGKAKDYILDGIMADGYLEDDNGDYYMVSNIVKIKFILKDSVDIDESRLREYNDELMPKFYSDKNVEKMR